MISKNLLTDRVAAHLAPLLPANSSTLIGLSGGVDSVVLLHVLHELAPRYSWRLSALHVHHGISPHASAWADFCTELCARHSIPLHIEHVDIAPLREMGIEAAARKLRHAAFSAQACDFVALAHHADDQAETLLLQLLRGAGVRGASAMPLLAKRKSSGVKFFPVCPEPSTMLRTNGHGKGATPENETRYARFPDGTTIHSTRLPKDGSQVAGYLTNPLQPSPQSSPHGGGGDRPFPLGGKVRMRAFLGEGANDSLREFHVNGMVEGHGVAIEKWASTGSARTESNHVHTGSIVRPLLHCSRQEILDYAADENLQWIEDESNVDDRYPRNFLRHRVLPLLGEKFPAYRDTLARSAQHFAEASILLDELAQLDAPNLFPSPLGITSDLAAVVMQPSRMASGLIRGARGEGCAYGDERQSLLEAARLQSLSQPRAKNLLRYFLHGHGAPMPQAVQLDDMLHQLCGAREDAAVCVAYGGWEVRRYQGRVYALRVLGEFDRSLILPWHGEAELEWPALNARLQFTRTQNSGISLAKLQRAPVMLRLRRGGETLRPHSNAATRTLKNLLQEHHIPPWQRDRLPLLYCGDELACVPGVAIASEYQAAVGEASIAVVFCPEP